MSQRPPFSLTILGSGTCAPSLSRLPAAYLLSTHLSRVLVDSGPGTIPRLLAVGVHPCDLHALCYTHFHLDHIADLLPLLFTFRNNPDRPRDTPLTLVGPSGFKAHLEALFQLYGRQVLSNRYPLDILELGPPFPDIAQLRDLQIHALPVAHSSPAIGYRFTDLFGRVIALSGDTDQGPSLIPLMAGTDLALVECSTPDEQKIPGHLSPSPLGKAAAIAQPRRLILSHFYPSADAVDMAALVRQHFPGDVQMASDGLCLEIP